MFPYDFIFLIIILNSVHTPYGSFYYVYTLNYNAFTKILCETIRK
jgi:hypothetical protein